MLSSYNEKIMLKFGEVKKVVKFESDSNLHPVAQWFLFTFYYKISSFRFKFVLDDKHYTNLCWKFLGLTKKKLKKIWCLVIWSDPQSDLKPFSELLIYFWTLLINSLYVPVRSLISFFTIRSSLQLITSSCLNDIHTFSYVYK